MDILAFLTIPAIAVANALSVAEQQEPGLPIFKRRRWFKDNRLDARPVAWSLRNRPEDWEYPADSRRRLIHKPSKHEFWVSKWNVDGYGFYRLLEANCSCMSRSERGKFQPFQQGLFGRAYKHWRRQYDKSNGVDAEQFAAHFVR